MRKYNKAIISAVATLAATIIVARQGDWDPVRVETLATAIVGLLGTLGVFQVRNAD